MLVWSLNLLQEIESLCDDKLLVPFARTMCFICLVCSIHIWKTSICFICFIFPKWTCYYSLFYLHMMDLFFGFSLFHLHMTNLFFFSFWMFCLHIHLQVIDLLFCSALILFLANDQFALMLCLSHLCVMDFLFCLFFFNVVDELACSFVLFVANL